jgi:hypothetical protein
VSTSVRVPIRKMFWRPIRFRYVGIEVIRSRASIDRRWFRSDFTQQRRRLLRTTFAWVLEAFREPAQFREYRVAKSKRARAAATVAGLPFVALRDKVESKVGHGPSCSKISPKGFLRTRSIRADASRQGFEFRAVAVIPCDDKVIPIQECIETVADDADMAEVYDSYMPRQRLVLRLVVILLDHRPVSMGFVPYFFLRTAHQ